MKVTMSTDQESRLERVWNKYRLARWLWWRLGGKVAGGFFAGMRYSSRTYRGNPGNKLVGTYELELNPIWERLSRNPPAVVFDVGAAEGYYAAGLAWRWKATQCQVYAWESDPRSHERMRVNAQSNGVEAQVKILGECDEPEFLEAIQNLHPGLIIVDIEGGERDLCSQRCLDASDGVWVVECHSSEILSLMQARFGVRFEWEVLPNRPRTNADLPRLPLLGAPLPGDRARLLDEGRHTPTPWLVATPKKA